MTDNTALTIAPQSGAVTTEQPRPGLLARMAGRYNLDPEVFKATVKGTCIKGKATNEQFVAFLVVANEYKLNPLTKEIYAFPQDGGIVPVVGVDGWSRIINDHPQFDGMEFEDTRSEDGSEIISITCRMYRRDRGRPIEATEYLSECKRGTQPWKQWPARMLRHKAMIQAARYAFGFTGIVEQDEYERMQEANRMRSEATRSTRESFGATEAERQRRLQARTIDADFTPDPEPEAADEAPARDIAEDLDDEIPPFDETEAGEVRPEPASQEGAVETPDERPSHGQDDPAPSDAEQDDSVKRWHLEALRALNAAKSPAERSRKLRALQDHPMFFEITDAQAAELKKAGEAA